jgi:predicted enzyme related to lactoylglutathione lyase
MTTATKRRSKTGVRRIQLVLPTHDIDWLQAFYSELFAAEEDSRVGGKRAPFFVCLRLGPADLVLVAYKRGAAEKPGRSTLAVFVDSVDDLLPRVEPAGGKVLGPAKNMRWGHRVAHITDPDGNPINLTQQL